MCLKINWPVKTPWHRPSMGVARSGLWASGISWFIHLFSVNARYFLQTVNIVNFEKQWEVRESRKSNQQCQDTNFGRGVGRIRRGLLTGLPRDTPSPLTLRPPLTLTDTPSPPLTDTPSPLTLTDLCTTIRANWTSHRSPGNAYTAS